MKNIIVTNFFLFCTICFAQKEKTWQSYNDDAITLFKNGQATEAYWKMNSAIRLNPKNANLYYVRGTIGQKAFNTYFGLDDFKKAIELSPKHTDAMLKCAIIYGKNNEKENSCKYFQMACNLNNKDGCEALNKFCKN